MSHVLCAALKSLPGSAPSGFVFKKFLNNRAVELQPCRPKLPALPVLGDQARRRTSKQTAAHHDILQRDEIPKNGYPGNCRGYHPSRTGNREGTCRPSSWRKRRHQASPGGIKSPSRRDKSPAYLRLGGRKVVTQGLGGNRQELHGNLKQQLAIKINPLVFHFSLRRHPMPITRLTNIWKD